MSLACPLVLCFPSLGGTLSARGSIGVHTAVVVMGGKKKKKAINCFAQRFLESRWSFL